MQRCWIGGVVLVFAAAAAAASGKGAYVVVDTGQDRCYDDRREIRGPATNAPFRGQDAQFQRHAPAYRDNGDGTVSDLNTGLMWQRDPGAKMTYDQAVAGARTFRLAGHGDWRLPTIKELYSLIDFRGTDPRPEMDNAAGALRPFINTNYFRFQYGKAGDGDRVIDSQYASATVQAGPAAGPGGRKIFGVNFADGRIKGYGRRLRDREKTFYVLYVRGNPDYGKNHFVDNGDGTIADAATGLMWSQADSGKGMTWAAALAWVQARNAEAYLGYGDWRLPNAKELQSLVDYARSPDATGSAAIDPLFRVSVLRNEAGQPDSPCYWTGTTHIEWNGQGSRAVYVAFGRAMGFMRGHWVDVHGAGSQRSDPKTGNPADYPEGRGPQGDAIRILNYVRLVRD